MENPFKKYTYDYPHPAVATDCVVFGFDGRELKVLLIQRGIAPYKGMWAFPGGFMRIDETAEECARRELREETGLELTYIKQLGTFTGVHRDPRERVISIAFYSLARHSEVRGGDDASIAKWWAIDDVPQLAFDHDYILRQAMKRIRQDIHFEPVGFGLLDEEFTIADLQRLYESILGVHFDRRNFYRKMLQTGILQEVEETQPPKSRFFGSQRQMKQMDIDQLFAMKGDSSVLMADSSMPDAAPMEDCMMPSSVTLPVKSHCLLDKSSSANMLNAQPQPLEEEATQRSVGRKGKLFRFDQAAYTRLKEEGNFRLEF